LVVKRNAAYNGTKNEERRNPAYNTTKHFRCCRKELIALQRNSSNVIPLDTVIITAKFSICEYIDSVQTLWALANVNKNCSNHLKNTIFVRLILDQNLNKLLHKYASSLPCLSKFLNAHQHSVVSGSILLQAFLGEEWESDLDIYLPFINNEQVTEHVWSLINGINREGASDWGILRNIIGPTEARAYLAKYLLYMIETKTYRG
jgi:hypothetical protein